MRRSQDEEVNEMAVWEEGKARDDADTTDEAATGVREGSVHKSERLRAGMRGRARVGGGGGADRGRPPPPHKRD